MRSGARFGQKLVALSMLLSVQSHAGLEKQYPQIEDTNRIAHSLLSVLGGCSDKIWPNLRAGELDMLLVNKELNNQILVSTKNQTISTIPNEELPPYVFYSTYSLIPYQGRQVLYMDSQIGFNRRTSRSMALDVLVHEAFHMVDQRSWVQKSDSGRGTMFPMLSEPRVARAMLYANLLKAFNEKNTADESLRKARFWYDEWLKSDPIEGEMTTDGYEGTAKYVETMASLYDQRGCGATEQELEQLASQQSLFQGLDRFGSASLDTEGYYVGGMASMLLRFRSPQVNWQARVAKGETPVEILLKDISPLSQKPRADLVSRISRSTAEQAKSVVEFLAPARELLEKKTTLFVSVPARAVETSFSPKGFFTERVTGIRYTPMAKELVFKFDDQNTHLKAMADAVFVEIPASPCSGGWDFVVDQADVVGKQNGRFEINAKLFTGSLGGEIKVDSKNRKWLCVR